MKLDHTCEVCSQASCRRLWNARRAEARLGKEHRGAISLHKAKVDGHLSFFGWSSRSRASVPTAAATAVSEPTAPSARPVRTASATRHHPGVLRAHHD